MRDHLQKFLAVVMLLCAPYALPASPDYEKFSGVSPSATMDQQMAGTATNGGGTAASTDTAAVDTTTQTPNPWQTSSVSTQSACPGCSMMGGMTSGMTGMASTPMPATGMSGMMMTAMPMGTTQSASMGMAQGMTIRDLLQLLTVGDILDSLLQLTDIQDKASASLSPDQRQNVSADLAALRQKLRSLLKDNRSEIAGQ